MFSPTVGQTLHAYRTRSGRSALDVAHAAGMTASQYEALEAGSGWPGKEAFAAAVEALQIPAAARTRLDFCGQPLDASLAAALRGFTVPAIVVDHGWRVVGANSEATRLFPKLGQSGWSLLRWVLCSPQARSRLVNAADVAGTFAAALTEALMVAPSDHDLWALHEEVTSGRWVSDWQGHPDVDGLDLVWRTDNGPYQMISLFVSVPARRPDLRQIALHIEPLVLPGKDLDTVQWPDSVLADIARCGTCQTSLTYEWGPVYRCPRGCFPAVDAAVLEDEVARLLLPHVYTDGTLASLAQLQEILVACGNEPALPAPVSLRHAFYQWRHEMPISTRRELVAGWVASVAVSSSGSLSAGVGVALDICWLPGR